MSYQPTVVQSHDMQAPAGSGATAAQRLAQTGTTEATNSTALTVGEMATIVVGAAAIRIVWLAATGAGTSVATTDLILPAYGRFDWMVTANTDFVAIEAADGSSAYEAWVWTSSGTR